MKYNYKDKQREINLQKEDFQSALELLLKIDQHLDKYKDKGLVTEIRNILRFGQPEEPKKPLSVKEINQALDDIFPVGTILYPEFGNAPKVTETFGTWEKIPYAHWFDGIQVHEYVLYKRVK